MENRAYEDSYLCFEANAIRYMVSVSNLDHICASEEELQTYGEAIPVVDFTDAAYMGHCAWLILQSAGLPYAVRVSHIIGMVSVSPEQQYEIPEVLQREDDDLCGITVQEEEACISYLIDSERLIGRALTQSGATHD